MEIFKPITLSMNWGHYTWIFSPGSRGRHFPCPTQTLALPYSPSISDCSEFNCRKIKLLVDCW